MMKINKVVLFLLTAGLLFACNQETEQKESNKFVGLWSLYLMEQQDSATGECS